MSYMHHHFHLLSRKMTVNVIDGRFCSRTSILRNIFLLVVRICIIFTDLSGTYVSGYCVSLILDINLYRLNDVNRMNTMENIQRMQRVCSKYIHV